LDLAGIKNVINPVIAKFWPDLAFPNFSKENDLKPFRDTNRIISIFLFLLKNHQGRKEMEEVRSTRSYQYER